ncbi:unnamed protein product [Penicillium viridicatum]
MAQLDAMHMDNCIWWILIWHSVPYEPPGRTANSYHRRRRLTQLRVRATQRAEQNEIVDEVSRLLDEAQMILVDFSDPYQSPASDLPWDIKARMEVLVDPLLGLWAEETQDHELEERIWTQLP